MNYAKERYDVQAVKTLAHELAHAVLHESALQDRATAELEAESVAYIVSSELGLDSSEYTFGYVSSSSRRWRQRPREAAGANG